MKKFSLVLAFLMVMASGLTGCVIRPAPRRTVRTTRVVHTRPARRTVVVRNRRPARRTTVVRTRRPARRTTVRRTRRPARRTTTVRTTRRRGGASATVRVRR